MASKPKPQNKQMHGRISHRIVCHSYGYTMKMSSGYHRFLIYDVKCATKIYGMGPFKLNDKCRRSNFMYSPLESWHSKVKLIMSVYPLAVCLSPLCLFISKQAEAQSGFMLKPEVQYT